MLAKETSKKRLLLTRSAKENILIKQQLAEFEVRMIECSLISYIDKEINFKEIFNKYRYIIITSKYAADIIVSKTIDFIDCHIFLVVGELSAQILQRKGLNIKLVASNVKDLIKNLEYIRIDREKMVYLSSNFITCPMPAKVDRQIIYEVEYKQRLNSYEIEEITKGIDYILIYSQNCAKTLIKLLAKYNLISLINNTKIIVISLKVANIIRLYFKNVIYCKDDNIIKLLIEDIEFGTSTANSK